MLKLTPSTLLVTLVAAVTPAQGYQLADEYWNVYSRDRPLEGSDAQLVGSPVKLTGIDEEKATRSSQLQDAFKENSQEKHTLSEVSVIDQSWKNAKPTQVTEIWRTESSALVASNPIPAGKMVLFTNWDGKLVAVDSKTGEQRWIVDGYMGEPPGERQLGPISKPLIQNDVVYINWRRDKVLHAIDINTGSTRWTFHDQTLDQGETLNLLEYGESLFLGSRHLYSIDPTNGNVRWIFETQSSISSMSRDEDLLVIGDRSGIVYGIDADKGREQWRFGDVEQPLYFQQFYSEFGRQAPEWEGEPPYDLYHWAQGICEMIIAEGKTAGDLSEMGQFLGEERFHALYNSSRKFICPPGTSQDDLQARNKAVLELSASQLTSPLVLTEDMACFLSIDLNSGRHLQCINRKNGELHFKREFGRSTRHGLVATNDLIIFIEGSALKAFEPHKRSQKWQLDLERYPGDTPFILSGSVVHVMMHQSFLTVNVDNGQVVQNIEARHSLCQGTVDTLCITSKSNVYGIAIDSGKLLWVLAKNKDLTGSGGKISLGGDSIYYATIKTVFGALR